MNQKVHWLRIGCGVQHLRGIFFGVIVTVLILIGGCVRRRMTVQTNPPGATVSIDNQVIGTSPVATAFTHHATREFRVSKEGFRTETFRRRIAPPWYQWPGLDFLFETLYPGEIRDERVIDVTMVPREMKPIDAVVQRADALRNQSASGVVTAPLR